MVPGIAAQIPYSSLYSSLNDSSAVCPPSAVPYSSNEGLETFMEKRETEGTCIPKACLHHL